MTYLSIYLVDLYNLVCGLFWNPPVAAFFMLVNPGGLQVRSK